ncbi:phosphoglycerate mutase family protein [Flavobacterium pedocola]
MKLLLTLIIMLSTQLGISQNSTTTFYLIRHAEKMDNSGNPELSENGLKRAENWSRILSDIKFDEVYSTNYKRTMTTAAPTAEKNQKTVKTYDPRALDTKVFLKENLNKNVLVVGHSNTIPKLVNQLIGKDVYADIDDAVFGNLYIVTINGNSVSYQLLKLQ